jgi:hypothetical protein
MDPLGWTEYLALERMRDHDVVGDFDGVHGMPFLFNRRSNGWSAIGLSMILSEKSATFRDHALAAG